MPTMKSKLKAIFKNIQQKDTLWILFSNAASRGISFLQTLLLMRLLTQSEFGAFSFAMSAISFLIPFNALGAVKGYMRFAPIQKSAEAKSALYNYVLKQGFKITCIQMLFFGLTITPFLPEIEHVKIYFVTLLLLLLSMFLLELIQFKMLVKHNNKTFARNTFITALISILFACAGAWQFGGIGALLGIGLAPLLIYFMSQKEKNSQQNELPASIEFMAFWRYNLFVGLGASASVLLLYMDTFFIGYITQDANLVAIYRTATLIPLSLFFIPQSMVQSEFASVAENYQNRTFLISYIKRYLALFVPIAFGAAGILIALKSFIYAYLFPESYLDASNVYTIIIGAMVLAFLLRTPFGNLLAAVGKSNWNTVIAFAMIFFNAIFNYFLINIYGIDGAALATLLVIGSSGLISIGLFFHYLSKYTH